MFSIGMETKKRPHENYLDTTLANMKRAGILNSPLLRDFVIADGEGYTRQQNGQRSIAMAVDRAKEGDWVIKLEDDLDFTDNFLGNVNAWLADFGRANVCMFSLAATFERVSLSKFNPDEHTIFDNQAAAASGFQGVCTSFPTVRRYLAHGEHCVPHSAQGFWGAQALVFKYEEAHHLAKWLGPDPALWDGKTHHRNRGHDLILQVWCKERGFRHIAVAVPSFVQHIGRRSNLDQPEINHVQPFFQFPFAGHNYRYERTR